MTTNQVLLGVGLILALGGDLLFLVRADGRLDPVTQVGPPEPQTGDTTVLLGPSAAGS